MEDLLQERLAIVEVVRNWAIWRDAGDWERFETVWHDDGWITATWFRDLRWNSSRSTAPGLKRASASCASWGIVRRQPIYEKDRMDPVDPSSRLELDAALLGRFPEGYRQLAYLQTKIGFTIKLDLPQLRGPVVEQLYAHGRDWLAGAASAFPDSYPPVPSR